MTTGKAIVRGEYNEGVVANPLVFNFVEDAPHVIIHCRDSGKITFEAFAFAQVIAQAPRPGVWIFLWTGLEWTVVIGIDNVLRVSSPGTVGRGVVNAEVKGLVVIGVIVDECEGVICDGGGHITRYGDEFAVAYQCGVVIGTTAFFVGKPVREAVLRQGAIAQVPFAR